LSHLSLHLHFGTEYSLYSSSPSMLSPFASVIFINTFNVIICSLKLRKWKFLRGEVSNDFSKLTETFHHLRHHFVSLYIIILTIFLPHSVLMKTEDLIVPDASYSSWYFDFLLLLAKHTVHIRSALLWFFHLLLNIWSMR